MIRSDRSVPKGFRFEIDFENFFRAGSGAGGGFLVPMGDEETETKNGRFPLHSRTL
jgi:hypothetical protein